LLGADTFPDVSTALSAISVGPSARQYVIVAPYPITPVVEPFTVQVHLVEDLRLRIGLVGGLIPVQPRLGRRGLGREPQVGRRGRRDVVGLGRRCDGQDIALRRVSVTVARSDLELVRRRRREVQDGRVSGPDRL
jgi:hypothetical protein